ncbi:hypothetical protein ACVBIV_02340 [Shewanella sp. 0m-9]
MKFHAWLLDLDLDLDRGLLKACLYDACLFDARFFKQWVNGCNG